MTKRPTYEELDARVKKLEKELAESASTREQIFEDQQFLQILIDTIPSPIFYKDKDGVYRHCNEAFSERILGISKNQVIDKSLFDLPEQIPVELAKIYEAKDQYLFDNPGTQTYKSDVKCSDGKVRVFQFYKSTTMSESGKVAGLVGIMLDITSLEESSSRLEKQNSELESLSYIDTLSGLYNRRKFEIIFPQQLNASGEKGRILNIAIIDIDYFKSYNDTYGHPKGDRAIKFVADVIKQNLKRPVDYAFRVGGEEFCLLFWSHDEVSAVVIANKIRTNVQELTIEHAGDGDEGVLTISMGLISICNKTNDGAMHYEEADRLLYQAKHSGRNNVKYKVY